MALGSLGLIWLTVPLIYVDSGVQVQTYKPQSSERPLITYAYFETDNARANAEYFIKHGIHDGADFLFILNGETNIYEMLPDLPYVSYVQRDNRCFDLGSQGEVLLRNKAELVKNYKKFILMNASIRGPFTPTWSDQCWSERYLDRVNEKTKLVGMTYNCKKTTDIPAHVSSMIWATDRTGLELLLRNGLGTCFKDKRQAIGVEIGSAKLMHDAGYEVEAMMTAYHSDPEYQEHCQHDDVNWENSYYGMSLHPYDTIFVKANRKIDENTLNTMTEWFDKMEYDSHAFCGSRRKLGKVGTVGERLAKEKAEGVQR
ncbi:hypothetical protein H072_3778 [Dactylellina haptotyla CBS 200.50]|uniref:1,3-beta-glucanosyltransferase n=1 Tax=Dactylellina haptotyla (strain CBS 200.50) TaxID=1284197 RepID=S8BRW6_DACHA|nr:hypothetical protein H072_3778 [Dactylellina haptotyla CBS 200.50]